MCQRTRKAGLCEPVYDDSPPPEQLRRPGARSNENNRQEGPVGRLAGHALLRGRGTSLRRAGRQGRHDAAYELCPQPHVSLGRRSVHDEQPVAGRNPFALDHHLGGGHLYALCTLLGVARAIPQALWTQAVPCHRVLLHRGGVRHHALTPCLEGRVDGAPRAWPQRVRAAYLGRVVRRRRRAWLCGRHPHRHRRLCDDLALHLPALRSAPHPRHRLHRLGSSGHGCALQVERTRRRGRAARGGGDGSNGEESAASAEPTGSSPGGGAQ